MSRVTYGGKAPRPAGRAAQATGRHRAVWVWTFAGEILILGAGDALVMDREASRRLAASILLAVEEAERA